VAVDEGSGAGDDEGFGAGVVVEEEEEETTYCVDTTPVLIDCSSSYPDWNYWQGGPAYDRGVHEVLGDEEEDVESLYNNTDVRRCFNCGSAEHTLSECPSPRNHALIALSRQLRTFHQSSHRRGDAERIHIVEAYKQQRLDWLDYFEPGQIKGDLLREALGLTDNGDGGGEEWLKNMTIWGYPKGWVGYRDPRYEVMKRIEWEGCDNDADDGDIFVIFGDVDDEEISLAAPPQDDLDALDDSDSDSDVAEPNKSTGSLLSVSPSPEPPPTLHRWACYPLTHFSSALLPIYTGFMLPAFRPMSETFTIDRQTLWQNITDGNVPPPPPSTSPPPLPPPPSSPPPPPPTTVFPSEESDGEAEMDLSDSD
jgi:zinc finger CCHC domain-containing protein 8